MLSDTDKNNIKDLYSQGMSKNGIARHLKIAQTTVKDFLARTEVPKVTTESKTEQPENNTLIVNGDTATFQGVTRNVIRSEDDAIREFNIDTVRWYVDTMRVKAWTTTMNINDRDVQVQNYRVTLNLRRVLKKSMEAAYDAIYERMAKYSPKYDYKPHKSKGDNSHLGVIGLFDAHFGKLCWGKEVGKDYDLDIAERIYDKSIDSMLNKSGSREVEQWLMPIGNDFFHIDNSKNTTYNGTPQDVDGRYARIIEAGEMSVIRAVERLVQVAPVHLTWVPGNHDPTTSFHLARTVAVWFRNHKHVSVDYSPPHRKYYRWHNTFLGMTHGDKEKKVSLPSIMATERKHDWAETTCHEWLCGHDHRSRKWFTQDVDTNEGLTIRTLRSIAGTDSWHDRNGYISGGSNAGELYYYHKETGYDGHDLIRVAS